MRSTNTLVVDYDINRYDFSDWARKTLGVNELSSIHLEKHIQKLNHGPVSNQLTQNFLEVAEIYDAFVIEVLGPIFDGIFDYQRPPSFRFHYKSQGNSAFHRDRDFGVESGRYNVWVPLTNVWGDNSLWIESDEGLEDYQPAVINYGQALIFDGVNLRHGSKVNTTPTSRVSFDLRFRPGPGPAIGTNY